MDEVQRSYSLFSACGLNCGLCPRFHTEGNSRCPGCGGAGFSAKHPPCGILSCCRRHGGIAYCYLCESYPCEKYEGAACYDSFITHQHMRQDFEKAKQFGLETYQDELNEKVDILQTLLRDFNDGRRKSLYCLAVNLLPLEDVQAVMREIAEIPADTSAKEKAAQAVQRLECVAARRGVSLRLQKYVAEAGKKRTT